MIIKVTQDDIDQGEPMKTGRCPVARALSREFPDQECCAGYREGWIGNKTIKFNEQTVAFMKYFDANGFGVPFQFELEFV